MNIRQAKDYVKDSVRLYLKKDEFGGYEIPVVRQRPIFLLGAPGIGKTAVMEQVAQELGIALVSYSMTHHTRQSALGLPFIVHKEYGGKPYDVSEYTMSEIIGSIYEVMEESGISEGILFLDEINCVSETLAPAMLQFLQYKIFGRHQVPNGWVIVTAGNPPEYNRSVREFDVVTMDRMRVLTVEADYEAWRTYAVERGIHGAVTGYLEMRREDFYRIETTAGGKSYVTARGWEDLSQMLKLYEEEGMTADETLIGQYLRNDRIAREFAAYYELYLKYRKEYPVEEILNGGDAKAAAAQAKQAPFDERLALLNILLERIQKEMRDVIRTADYLTALKPMLKEMLERGVSPEKLQEKTQQMKKRMEALEKASALSSEEKYKQRRIIHFFGQKSELKEHYAREVQQLQAQTGQTKERLHRLFAFVEEAFAGGNEMLILVTELTVNASSARFIGLFGSEDYQKHQQGLMLTERSAQLQEEIAKLGL